MAKTFKKTHKRASRQTAAVSKEGIRTENAVETNPEKASGKVPPARGSNGQFISSAKKTKATAKSPCKPAFEKKALSAANKQTISESKPAAAKDRAAKTGGNDLHKSGKAARLKAIGDKTDKSSAKSTSQAANRANHIPDITKMVAGQPKAKGIKAANKPAKAKISTADGNNNAAKLKQAKSGGSEQTIPAVRDAGSAKRTGEQARTSTAIDGDNKAAGNAKRARGRPFGSFNPNKISIDEARDRDLASKNAARKAAQCIGEILPPENPSRRAAALASFKYFCEAYFPDAFYLDWSNDHLKVISRIELAVKEGKLFAFAMPRGSGKSTLIIAAAIWAILGGSRRYVCIIGSAAKQSLNLFQSIQATLMGNALLLADFAEVVYPIRCLENNAHKARGQRTIDGDLTHIEWGTHKMVMARIPGSQASGSVIAVDSLDSNIRGQIHTTLDGKVLRPDLVLVDDPQTRESAKSVDQTSQRLKIINGDVLGMAGPGKKIAGLLTCTVIFKNDLADQILDRQKNPDWAGEQTSLVYAMPANRKLWDKYNQVRCDELRDEGDGSLARAFYIDNRAELDSGSVVAWEHRFNPDEVSAIQHAMNLFYRDEATFAAEYQNQPLEDRESEELLKVDDVLSRLNGRKQYDIPLRAVYLVGFVDVHDKLLFYKVWAFEEDFTGYCVDYGTWPQQNRMQFTMRQANVTLAKTYKGAGVDGAIAAGLEELCRNLTNRQWKKSNGGSVRLDRLLVDSGYKPGIVESVRYKVGSVMMASKGVGIKAGNRPMTNYQKKPGERYGQNWYVPNITQTREFPHVKIDTNFWKSFVHEHLKMTPGEKGSFTLFGESAAAHRLLAEHIAGSETWVRTEGHGRQVHEWKLRPNAPDNHWFDCAVGCAVAASMCGAKTAGQNVATQERKKVSFAQMQAEAKNRRH